MVSTLNETQRSAVAVKLADMKLLQGLLISNEQKLLSQCDDEEIRDRLGDMLEDDQKNMGIIESVIAQYGTTAEPQDKVQKFVEQAQGAMEGSELTLYEKVSQHELLKHSHVMKGLVVHKAAQVLGETVRKTIEPLYTVNFENRAHQEQLKGVLYILGTRELTGQDPEQGVWVGVQDTIAALKGIVGGVADRT